MAKFAYLYRSGRQSPGSPAEMQAEMQKWRVWMKELADRGHLKDVGSPLDRPGRTLRGRERKNMTDGPFAEKDIVTGYSLIEAKDLDEAGALATGCPVFDNGGSVEVRPILEFTP
jgi:hypothetical protein